MHKSKEQKLVDICFNLVLVSTDPANSKFFKKLNREEKMAWVTEQLKDCGFPTHPCGASWGVLDYEGIFEEEL